MIASRWIPLRYRSVPRGQVSQPRAAYLVLGALLALVVWPAWITAHELVIGGDALIIHYPWFVFWRDTLAAGEFPLWNPYTLGGLPALATLQAGYAYPPHWLLTWLPPERALNWTVGLHILLAGLGTAWCAGRMGAGPEGRVLAGAAYALGSPMVARLSAGHLSFLEANAWLPIATGCALRLRRRRDVGGLALVVGLLALAGQPEVLIFSLWWLPLWSVAGAVGGRHPRLPGALVGRIVRVLALAVPAIGLGGALAAAQLLPALAVLDVSNRAQGMSWDFRTDASFPPWHLLSVLAPTVFGAPQPMSKLAYWAGPWYAWHERLLYVGIVPLLAAGCAPRRWRWLCLGLALVSIGLAFGRYVPWYVWAQLLPGYSSFRIPSKHLGLAALALALAAGVGVDRFRGWRVALATWVAAGCVAVIGLTYSAWLPGLIRAFQAFDESDQPIGVVNTLALAVAVLAMLCAGGAALLPNVWAPRTLAILACLDLVIVLGPYRLVPADPQSIASPLAGLQDLGRVVVVGDNSAIDGNYGSVVRVAQPAGYTSLFSSGYVQLVTGQPDPGVAFDIQDADDPVLRLLGYRAVFNPGDRTIAVFQPAPPRVWVAGCAWPGGAAEVRAADFPLLMCVARADTATREPVVPPSGASITAEGNAWLQLEASGPGWLFTNEPWYPGWSADVDGVSQPVEVLDGAIVGTHLSSGTHTVMLRYVPGGLSAGLGLSCLAALAIAACWWPRRRRSSADEPVSGAGTRRS